MWEMGPPLQSAAACCVPRYTVCCVFSTDMTSIYLEMIICVYLSSNHTGHISPLDTGAVLEL